MSVIPQTPRASGGFAPWATHHGSALDPLGDLRSPELSPTHAPLTTNPGSAPQYYLPFWMFSPRCYQQIFAMGFSTLKTSFGLNLINKLTFCILLRNRQGYKVECIHDP